MPDIKEREINTIGFQTGQEIRIFTIGDREMGVSEANVAAVKDISEREATRCQQRAGVCLKDFGGFWTNLATLFNGPLAEYNNRLLRKMTLPVMVPKGIGLSQLPDSGARFLVVLSSGNWHGVILCSQVHEQPILLGSFTPSRNGDVSGLIERSNVDDILLIDVISLLKREGFLTVVV
ncbi:MAG: hypothetical protein KKG47_11340 [Proteobacteria bacterium]|nr:hypothetical protein [Pseudomonadota bacterium]MBU1739408.1 hypothetical protein [Pseudomonadota bacterium]